MARDAIYQLPAFHFQVTFLDNVESDTSFQEVDGLAAKIEVETVVEGGENTFVHRLPKPVTHPNLVLKRGIAASWSPLVKWCKAVFEGEFAKPIQPKDLNVSLLDHYSEGTRIWSIRGAFPVAWTVETFNATKNEVAIERIELSYSTLVRTK